MIFNGLKNSGEHLENDGGCLAYKVCGAVIVSVLHFPNFES